MQTLSVGLNTCNTYSKYCIPSKWGASPPTAERCARMPTAPFARNHCPSHSLSFAVAAAPTSKIKVSQSLSIAFTLTKSSGAAGGRPGKLDFKDGGKDKVKLDAIPPEVYDPAVVEAEEPITEMLVHCTLRHVCMTNTGVHSF